MVNTKFFALDIFSSSPALVRSRNHVYITDPIIAHHNIRQRTLAIWTMNWLADSVKLGVDAM